MVPILFRISDSIAIQSYGAAIALGLAIFIYLTYNNSLRKKLISDDNFFNLIFYSIIAGIAGGRILHIISNLNDYSWPDMIKIYQGGFSVLGSIIGVSSFIYIFLRIKKISFKILDILCLYAPVLQSISRIGCFLSGCCYGKKSSLYWAIKYINPDCSAPLNIYLHPTQIYSSILLLLCFLFLRYNYKSWIKTPGKIFGVYLLLTSVERFSLDFLRNDREFISVTSHETNLYIFKLLSLAQLIALGIITLVLLSFVVLRLNQIKTKSITT